MKRNGPARPGPARSDRLTAPRHPLGGLGPRQPYEPFLAQGWPLLRPPSGFVRNPGAVGRGGRPPRPTARLHCVGWVVPRGKVWLGIRKSPAGKVWLGRRRPAQRRGRAGRAGAGMYV